MEKCDVCGLELKDTDNQCLYCQAMARNEVTRARVHRIAQFTEWLAEEGVWLLLGAIGFVRDMRDAGSDRAAVRATNGSDDMLTEISPPSVRSKSANATSGDAQRDGNQANKPDSPLPREPGAGQHIAENGSRKMDRQEKMRVREYIGKHVDVSATRLKDGDADRLVEFIDNYDSRRGQSDTRTWRSDGWSSDGKYTRQHQQTDTFTDEVGIRQDYSYEDDDGQKGSETTEIKDARGILNWLKDHG